MAIAGLKFASEGDRKEAISRIQMRLLLADQFGDDEMRSACLAAISEIERDREKRAAYLTDRDPGDEQP